mmetsp:Transcript_29771/g.33380  ORF Transcript_29771/g.33380 Transcript_29771/m.33380 type:complete len:183 (+) Transcript_29771:1-549(+)
MELLVSIRYRQVVTSYCISNSNSNCNSNRTRQGGREEVIDDCKINSCTRAFAVAKSLYRLAIENVSGVVGVDKICYVALFNNISHTCKTLHGYDSQEAYQYDDLLLKAIFWWRDSADESSSSSSSIRTRLRTNSNNDGMSSATTTTIMNNYTDNDFDIIDVFLENVFYLIGAQDAFVPAPAA